MSAEKKKQPSFEEALEALEALVEGLEKGDTPLAETVSQYAEGHRLLAICRKRLDEAEFKIEQLKNGKAEALDLSSKPE